MKYFKCLLVSCLFVASFFTAASAQNLNLGMVPLPCSSFGAAANLPISLTNAPGIAIAGVSADITFDESYFEYLGATIGAAGTAAGKDIESTLLAPGTVRIGVFSQANTTVIGNGVVAIVNFRLLKNPVGGVNLGIAAGASDPDGNPVVITSTTTGGFYTVKTGDIDRDGTVEINEVISTIAMFLGFGTVNPICDVNGDGIVQISDVVKVINCALETPTCACDVTPDEPRQETEWQGSGHADTGSEAFNHWNGDGAVSASCAKCHSTPGYVQYVNGQAVTSAPVGTVITCEACHDAAADDMTSVAFESTSPVVTISGLGNEARCFVCHQGRYSKSTIDSYIAGRATLAGDPDAVDAGASFRNVHYMPAAAIQYGTLVKVGYEYTGKTYDAKFAHVANYDTCITCHNPHSLELEYNKCATCHTGSINAAAVRNIRMKGSLEDYDGDGNEDEGMYYEVAGVQAQLYAAIQQYASVVSGVAIGYNADAHPYWFVDADGNGVIDDNETAGYNGHTARLLKATHNYQIVAKDHGAYAHGGKYVIQLMVDAIEDLNAGIVAAAGTPVVDLAALIRDDEGHFAGSSEAWRHWDVNPSVPGSCAKCHSGEGIPFFLTNGINIAAEQANGMMCVNCHTSVTDTVAPRRTVNSVVFPSGLTAGFGAGADSNLCLLCHMGRESTVSVDARIASGPGPYGFLNVHYFPAGATLFGTQARSAYEYSARLGTYAGQNAYSAHGGMFNNCEQCHMGTASIHPDYASHNVAKPNINNCICHFGDVSQTPGAPAFENIRPAGGIGSTDYDGDGNVTESLREEIAGLEADLYAAIQVYAAGTVGRAIVYNPAAYPYWFYDADASGDYSAGDSSYGNNFDASLLQACYNYQYSQKEPNAFIHNPRYIAQIVHDSLRDLDGGADLAWR